MAISNRIERLGTGVFHRNDIRKHSYRIASSDNLWPQLLDFSLGSTDLLPPKVALEAISNALFEALYTFLINNLCCRHAHTFNFFASSFFNYT